MESNNAYAGTMMTGQILTALRQIAQAIDLHSRYLEKNYSITGPQLIVLQVVRQNKMISIGKVAAEMSLNISTVTGIVARLEKKNLLTRTRCAKDKRRFLLNLTGEGEHFLQTAPQPVQEQFLTRFEGLENWEKNMILSSLQRLVDLMQAPDSAMAPSGVVRDSNELNARPGIELLYDPGPQNL
ncbi:MAG: MarR family transcriptional regulator [Desulfobulbaceae bacterium]|nr:MarR family transcriptional regulator [Desulfobulbaceae bacterium]